MGRRDCEEGRDEEKREVSMEMRKERARFDGKEAMEADFRSREFILLGSVFALLKRNPRNETQLERLSAGFWRGREIFIWDAEGFRGLRDVLRMGWVRVMDFGHVGCWIRA